MLMTDQYDMLVSKLAKVVLGTDDEVALCLLVVRYNFAIVSVSNSLILCIMACCCHNFICHLFL